MSEGLRDMIDTKQKILYSSQQIKERCRELGAKIVAEYDDDKPILCVCVLRGAVMFFTDLIKELRGKDVILDFIGLSSYDNGTVSTGKVKLIHDSRETAQNRHVLIVEDIIDSGNTISYLRQHFEQKNPIDVKVVCLLDKPMSRKVDARIDYSAFVLDSQAFVVGYGLDLAQKYRNLDAIYLLTIDDNV